MRLEFNNDFTMIEECCLNIYPLDCGKFVVVYHLICLNDFIRKQHAKHEFDLWLLLFTNSRGVCLVRFTLGGPVRFCVTEEALWPQWWGILGCRRRWWTAGSGARCPPLRRRLTWWPISWAASRWPVPPPPRSGSWALWRRPSALTSPRTSPGSWRLWSSHPARTPAPDRWQRLPAEEQEVERAESNPTTPSRRVCACRTTPAMLKVSVTALRCRSSCSPQPTSSTSGCPQN